MGFTTWPLRDIIFVGLILVNAGITIGVYVNHIKHIRDDVKKLRLDLDSLGTTVNKNGENLARLEGRMNAGGKK